MSGTSTRLPLYPAALALPRSYSQAVLLTSCAFRYSTGRHARVVHIARTEDRRASHLRGVVDLCQYANLRSMLYWPWGGLARQVRSWRPGLCHVLTRPSAVDLRQNPTRLLGRTHHHRTLLPNLLRSRSRARALRSKLRATCHLLKMHLCRIRLVSCDYRLPRMTLLISGRGASGRRRRSTKSAIRHVSCVPHPQSRHAVLYVVVYLCYLLLSFGLLSTPSLSVRVPPSHCSSS